MAPRPWLALLLFVPGALAGTQAEPELEDGPGDVQFQPGTPGLGDGPWMAADLRATWVEDDGEGLHATMLVEDLSAVTMTDAGVQQDTMWFVLWQVHYQNTTGAAARTGEWMLRAEYRPLDANAWHFWLERPCKDGNDDDGCAGDDRDIIDGLPGVVDETASTVRISAPWRYLATPQPGDGIWGLRASAQMVWPSYPAYAVDWDDDENACYLFTAVPESPDDAGPGNDGPTGSSHGATMIARPQTDTCPAFGSAPDPPAPAQVDNGTGNETGNETGPAPPGPPRNSTPWPIWALGALLVLARRR